MNTSNNCDNSHLESEKIDLDIFKEVTILAVDDDQNILFLITEMFAFYGIKIRTASSALEAVEIIKHCHLDLLISDITMPGEDGYWLLEKIRTLSSPQKKEIPAIAFTGIPENKVDKKAKLSGFQTYIHKPSFGDKLIIEAAKLLENPSVSNPTTLVANSV
jgi:two-component system OmpR family response regulator